MIQHTPYVLVRLTGVLAPALAADSAFAQASPAGTWKTIDNSTGKQKDEVTTVDNSGTLTGKVSRILIPGGENKTCTKCTDDCKDQPIKGLTILTGLESNGNNNWDDGQILDPGNGKVYSARMSLSGDGQKLNVHDYLGVSLLGCTQTWIREQ